MGIKTAADLAGADMASIRSNFSVVLERTARELRGVSCIPLESEAANRQQIACTRSFGMPVTELQPLLDAVSSFVQRAAEKLRAQKLRAGVVHVFAHSSPFRSNDPRFARSATVPLPEPTSDTSALAAVAEQAIRGIYVPGYRLAKAGVMLLDLSDSVREQESFQFEAPVVSRDRSQLMEAVDSINKRWGKGAVSIGSAQANGAWQMRQERRTPCYTTDIESIPQVR